MARSPSDATRFTATGPYVSTKPSNPTSNTSFHAAPLPGTRLNIGGPAPAGETPQQKIARLRAAAAAAKLGHETNVDRAVRIGRRWADRAHRFTALGLIGLTLISGAVATAGITDMIMHNRRRRTEWLANKQAQSAREVAEARQALSEGRASEDQILLINRERVAQESADALKNRPGMFKSATNYIFGAGAKEEPKGGRLGAAAVKASDEIAHLKSRAESWGESVKQRGEDALAHVSDSIETRRRQGESAIEAGLQAGGGPLDRQAQIMTDVAKSTSRSWTSWLTGR